MKLKAIVFEKRGEGFKTEEYGAELYWNQNKLTWFLKIKGLNIEIPFPSIAVSKDRKEYDLSFIYGNYVFILRKGLDVFELLKPEFILEKEKKVEFVSYPIPKELWLAYEWEKIEEQFGKKSFFEKYFNYILGAILVVLMIVGLYSIITIVNQNFQVIKEFRDVLDKLANAISQLSQAQQTQTVVPAK